MEENTKPKVTKKYVSQRRNRYENERPKEKHTAEKMFDFLIDFMFLEKRKGGVVYNLVYGMTIWVPTMYVVWYYFLVEYYHYNRDPANYGWMVYGVPIRMELASIVIYLVKFILPTEQRISEGHPLFYRIQLVAFAMSACIFLVFYSIFDTPPLLVLLIITVLFWFRTLLPNVALVICADALLTESSSTGLLQQVLYSPMALFFLIRYGPPMIVILVFMYRVVANYIFYNGYSEDSIPVSSIITATGIEESIKEVLDTVQNCPLTAT